MCACVCGQEALEKRARLGLVLMLGPVGSRCGVLGGHVGGGEGNWNGAAF